MKNLNPMLMADFYKLSHRDQYPKGTEKIYSTWTSRGSRLQGIQYNVLFGLQAFIKKYLIEYFNDEFFNKNIEDIITDYKRVIKNTLFVENPETQHIESLHKLGYLPLKITAVDEGMVLPLRVPSVTIENTHPEFFWLTNYIETLMSAELWHPCTTAAIGKKYRSILEYWANKTTDDNSFVDFQAHGFEMRGMVGLNGGLSSGAGHLLSFKGSDTVPAYNYFENYYYADIEKELVMCSIPASEHSVQCTYGDDHEYFRALIEDIYPNGFVSIVSDGYDYWDMIDVVIVSLKDKIMARDGKVVVRGDSGDPIKILCGDPHAKEDSIRKGTVERLWEIFGGTVNSKGYKVLDTHIGTIYGDAITIERADEICRQLKEKGFASSNVVFGIGSYTYQYLTRDSLGYALKSTYAIVNGVEKQIFKDPKTDDGLKKSQKGMVAVIKDKNGKIEFIDELTKESKKNLASMDLLQTIFEDGWFEKEYTLDGIRKRLASQQI